MTEKAAQWVNFRRFSLVFLLFINRSPWKLVKMCILISLTNHITTTFLSDHFYIPKQANIWQKRLRPGSIFADLCSRCSKFLQFSLFLWRMQRTKNSWIWKMRQKKFRVKRFGDRWAVSAGLWLSWPDLVWIWPDSTLSRLKSFGHTQPIADPKLIFSIRITKPP